MKGLRRKSRKQYGDDNFYSHRASSSPDLTATGLQNELRWATIHPHEYITVDELHFYRRKKPTGEQQKSNFCLYNKSEPIISYAEFKTEYQKRYSEPPASPRARLIRTPTSLQIDVGSMDGCSEQQSQFIAYPEETILRARRPLIKYPENLTLSGDLELFPEYRSAFVAYNLSKVGRSIDNVMTRGERRNQTTEPTFLDRIVQEAQPTDERDKHSNNIINDRKSSHTNSVKKANKYLKSILKSENETEYSGQYNTKIIDYPIGKSSSIPQMSNIKCQGDFNGVPEYTESFKEHYHFTKSAPIKKVDNLNLNGTMKPSNSSGYVGSGLPTENKERFKEPDKYERNVSFKKKDNLQMRGDFTDRLPEYNEKFKNPNITSMPVRAKARETFLNLKGTNEFNPEYKCTYLDFPRSRPIVKKPGTNIKMTANENYEKYREDLQPSIRSKHVDKLRNIHNVPSIDDSENELPYHQRPEYRKAKREMLIRERPPVIKHNLNQHAVEPIKILNKNVIGLPIDRNNKFDVNNNNNKTVKMISANRRKVDHNSNTESQYDDTSTSESPKRNLNNEQPTGFKYIVENVDDVGGSFKKKTAKFGRRSSVVMDDPPPHNVRHRTNVIEGNSNYLRENDDYYKQERKRLQANKNQEDSSFVVLEQPTKSNTWMKPKWFHN